ncbi:MAG: type II toxin-antitoxin system VapC family toxin [Kiritimatiellia bacterium]|jgi:predicted nucleic acid-binding protein|nr:type II toxin-antitoxin system VapC family toxin [Kiritimatiellia bacterium]MDP6810118.1 type II toxin-antitoxin system VapC family toxin [Kiritimatiellia bacterium]MDP7023664.1 type II toxin-antitoxin system VapC family toxin [Kiritimatiellia bacterium]
MIGVIDTSALLRLYIPDGPIPDGLEAFMRAVEYGENVAIAPELMLAEAGNVVSKKHRQGVLSAEEMNELVGLISRMPVRYISHRKLIVPAVDLAVDSGLTVYDALFLVLARQKSARLFTADMRLQKAAKKYGARI